MQTSAQQHAPDEPFDDDDRQYESDPGVVARIIADRRARRELIWLSHMAKGDHENARDIERYDPHVRRRLAPSFARLWSALHACECGYCNRTTGREGLYGLLFDQRWRHHAARYAGVSCACLDCGGSFVP